MATVAELFVALDPVPEFRAIADAASKVGSPQIRSKATMAGRKLDRALLEEVTAITAQTIHNNCRPTNRLYKTEAARGLAADLFDMIQERIS